jgi:hypothetical protein
MLAPSIIEEIRSLLARNLSYRTIARMTGVGRGTIGAIATGKRPDYPARMPKNPTAPPAGPPRRCPSCGGMVRMPCQLCHLRALIGTGEQAPFSRGADEEGTIRMDLIDEHHVRYLALRPSHLPPLSRRETA